LLRYTIRSLKLDTLVYRLSRQAPGCEKVSVPTFPENLCSDPANVGMVAYVLGDRVGGVEE
jgi:hypothetical protein